MNKWLLLTVTLLTTTLLSACTPTEKDVTPETSTLTIQVKEKLTLALANKDYRLLGLSGRRITAPGVPTKQMTEAIKLCGIKILPNSGDVVRNEQDKAARKSVFQLAEQFNLKMFRHCQKYHSK